MRTIFIEAEDESKFNFGKFMLGIFGEEEWQYDSVIDKGRRLLDLRRWTKQHILILDCATGEGALFLLGGNAEADLEKHRVWVCPLYQPFLTWLYKHYNENGLEGLPNYVNLGKCETAISGYRRSGSL